MKCILLTNGGITIVDDDIYEWASKEKWCWNSKYGVQNTKSGKILHRLIMKATKGIMVDHINHFRWDNGRSNLRLCTRAENLRNRLTNKTAKSSQYKGVCFHKNHKRWESYIGGGVKGRRIYLGLFDTEIEAALAYNEAAKLHFGEFALLNSMPS